MIEVGEAALDLPINLPRPPRAWFRRGSALEGAILRHLFGAARLGEDA